MVTALDHAPQLVRDQIKAKCTLELRATNESFHGRDVWTTGGDIEFLDTDEQIDSCVGYVTEVQDRKTG